ncbi:rCG58216 [Rattus norvegicus]|uniref:RCG58216 n=1 Tax=Rattus norvegicus TaxID=10116 RepID=A6J428_RAT|nr:rCG58216 [Rattus norvegicus]
MAQQLRALLKVLSSNPNNHMVCLKTATVCLCRINK